MKKCNSHRSLTAPDYIIKALHFGATDTPNPDLDHHHLGRISEARSNPRPSVKASNTLPFELQILQQSNSRWMKLALYMQDFLYYQIVEVFPQTHPYYS